MLDFNSQVIKTDLWFDTCNPGSPGSPRSPWYPCWPWKVRETNKPPAIYRQFQKTVYENNFRATLKLQESFRACLASSRSIKITGIGSFGAHQSWLHFHILPKLTEFCLKKSQIQPRHINKTIDNTWLSNATRDQKHEKDLSTRDQQTAKDVNTDAIIFQPTKCHL